jgi:anti-anti-sigma factor
MTLNITTEEFKRCTVIKPSGRIDSSNATDFDKVLHDTIEGGQKNIVLDLSEIEYMSSAALRAIVGARKEVKAGLFDGDVRIATPSDRADEVLKLSGMGRLFQMFDTVHAAVASY